MPKTSQHRPARRPADITNRQPEPIPSPTLPEDVPRRTRIRHPSPESPAAVRIRSRQTRTRLRRQKLFFSALILLLLTAIGGVIGSAVYRAAVRHNEAAGTSSLPTTDRPDTLSPHTGDPQTHLPIAVPIPEKTVICLDPGHGYGDPGTGSDLLLPYYEKDINLAITLKLRDMLLSEGYQVVLTRDSDIPPHEGDLLTPADRIEMLRGMEEVDYFLSLHCNSYIGDKRASGARLYYYTENSALTPSLAQSIAQSIASRLGVALPSLTAFASDAFVVTKHTICPALLIEVGFVTDEDDAANMKNDAWQTQMARAIANGLTAHIQAQES